LFSFVPFLPAGGYIGGKRNLSRRICAIIEATPHTSYAEPFVGMGGIFPAGRAAPQGRGDQRYFMLRFRAVGQAEFERLLAQPPERLTDLQRAVRFLYVQRLAPRAPGSGARGSIR
jgi:DNA adenine methylase